MIIEKPQACYEFRTSEKKGKLIRGCENQCQRPFVFTMLQPDAAGCA